MKEQKANAYRAIGRYVVEFSALIYRMRMLMELRLKTADDEPLFAQLVLSEATAGPIANAFFAMCEAHRDFDRDEKQIAQTLKKRVDKAIETRNDIAHGDWQVGVINFEKEEMSDPRLTRTKPTRAKGPISVRELPPKQLEEWAADLSDLESLVFDFGAVCLGDRHVPIAERIRVRDVLVLRDGKVVREGQSAGGFSVSL